MNSFSGKRILVTGAGCRARDIGIGRAICLRLATLGAHIIALDKDKDALHVTHDMIVEMGGLVSTFECDVTDREQISKTFRLIEDLGPLAGLVNAVGGGKPGGIQTLPYDDWQEALELNLNSAFMVTRLAVSSFLKNGSGGIVFIGSLHGNRYPGIPMIGYSVAKAALAQLSKHVALEFASQNIRSNIVLAGAVDTPQIRSRVVSRYGRENEDEVMKLRASHVPQGRAATVDDIAGAVAFLLSESAAHITAAELPVDGGASFVTVPSYIPEANLRYLKKAK